MDSEQTKDDESDFAFSKLVGAVSDSAYGEGAQGSDGALVSDPSVDITWRYLDDANLFAGQMQIKPMSDFNLCIVMVCQRMSVNNLSGRTNRCPELITTEHYLKHV